MPAKADFKVHSTHSSTAAPDASAATRGNDQPHRFQSHDSQWKQTQKVIAARFRSLSDRILRRLMQRTLKIGISARICHPEAGSKGLRSKTLQYLEESIARGDPRLREKEVVLISRVNVRNTPAVVTHFNRRAQAGRT